MKRFISRFIVLTALLFMTACAEMPKEAVELSNTVGRDLEEVHRAHRALANLYFDTIESKVIRFIDNEYRPSYVKLFAQNFKLIDQTKLILANKPDDLLIVMQRFVEIAIRDVEAKRSELLGSIIEQRRSVISEIDESHRKIQAAHAIVTGHLASVLKVHEAQAEILNKVGVGDLRAKITTRTADLSRNVADITDKAEGFYSKLESFKGDATIKLKELDAVADKINTTVRTAFK